MWHETRPQRSLIRGTEVAVMSDLEYSPLHPTSDNGDRHPLLSHPLGVGEKRRSVDDEGGGPAVKRLNINQGGLSTGTVTDSN